MRVQRIRREKREEILPLCFRIACSFIFSFFRFVDCISFFVRSLLFRRYPPPTSSIYYPDSDIPHPCKTCFFFVSSFSRLTLSFIKSAHEGKVIDSFHYFRQLGLLLDTVPRLIPAPNKTPRPRPHRHPLQSIPRTISSLLPHHLVVLEGITIVSGYRCVG